VLHTPEVTALHLNALKSGARAGDTCVIADILSKHARYLTLKLQVHSVQQFVNCLPKAYYQYSSISTPPVSEILKIRVSHSAYIVQYLYGYLYLKKIYNDFSLIQQLMTGFYNRGSVYCAVRNGSLNKAICV
jgi:hypothetical protein